MVAVLIFYVIVAAFILFIELMIGFKLRKTSTEESLIVFASRGKSHWFLKTMIALFWLPILIAFGIFLVFK